MIKSVLQSIDGIELYPIISLLLFFSVFTLMVIKAMKADKTYLRKMSELPLDSNSYNKETRS